ncbi:MAG TPA: EFR1 family ferrodoxin [Spirochaetota bacterium]|nr:EFR1 family ferrodoxin [Spirochaetota bacterium]HPI90337.1 EFR1 family ferrodoxin [Spirochaetota bacterium]HPR49426.1 EFR1 family ferrodoxin [Spirochaetota bacterium]
MERLSVQKAALIYFSPHGTSKKSIESVASGLAAAGLHGDYFDAARFIRSGNTSELYVQLSYYKLLVISSPVYAHHVPPVFGKMLEKIPVLTKDQAVAFVVNYGGVSSGVALQELAKMFAVKGFRLLGGIKVAAEHCLMFQSADPINSGRPASGDHQALVSFGRTLVERLTSRDRKEFKVGDFVDKSLGLRVMDSFFFNMSATRKVLPPISINNELCTKCMICASSCPTANIEIRNDIQFKDRCINCYQCVRLCPEKALNATMDGVEKLLRDLKVRLAKYETGETLQVV